jgi:ADP-ribose pyrophosphatase YjhB (NUDIX family)
VQRVAAYGLHHDAHGRVLLVRAAPWVVLAGVWFLPGGGVHHGEDPEDALVREFAEETGLAVEPGPLLGVLSDVFERPDGPVVHSIRLCYRVVRVAGTLRAETDGSSDAVAYVAPGELADLPLMDYVARALERFGPPGP